MRKVEIKIAKGKFLLYFVERKMDVNENETK